MANNANGVRLDSDALVLGDLVVSFQRTLRVPENGVQPLPPGLGRFPLADVKTLDELLGGRRRSRGDRPAEVDHPGRSRQEGISGSRRRLVRSGLALRST